MRKFNRNLFLVDLNFPRNHFNTSLNAFFDGRLRCNETFIFRAWQISKDRSTIIHLTYRHQLGTLFGLKLIWTSSISINLCAWLRSKFLYRVFVQFWSTWTYLSKTFKSAPAIITIKKALLYLTNTTVTYLPRY